MLKQKDLYKRIRIYDKLLTGYEGYSWAKHVNLKMNLTNDGQG